MITGPLLVGLGTSCVTLIGGALALRFEARRAPLVGFASGAVIGVALLDLLPEAIRLGVPRHSLPVIIAMVACGLLGYILINRLMINGLSFRRVNSRSERRGHMAPFSLTVHSAMDGLAIGLAFQFSYASGLAVAFGVIAHDLVDGVNTVTLSLASGTTRVAARRWLIADALVPLVGIALARLIPASASLLSLILAFFAGGFLYIGTNELVFKREKRAFNFTKVAAAGIGFVFVSEVIQFAPN